MASVDEKNSLTLEKMADQNKQHYADDERNFSAINDKLDKREELAKIHGDHLSHIRKEMVESKQDIGEIKKIVQDIILPHITATSPILKEYQEKQETERTLIRIGTSIKKYGLIVVLFASILAGIVTIINFFKFK